MFSYKFPCGILASAHQSAANANIPQRKLTQQLVKGLVRTAEQRMTNDNAIPIRYTAENDSLNITIFLTKKQ